MQVKVPCKHTIYNILICYLQITSDDSPHCARVCLRACVCASNQPGNKLYDNAYFVFVCRNTTERNKNPKTAENAIAQNVHSIYRIYPLELAMFTPDANLTLRCLASDDYETFYGQKNQQQQQYKFSASKNQHERSYLLHSFFFLASM